RFPFFLRALCDGSAPLFFSLATRHSPPAPVIPAPWATAALRVVPVPIFTTTLRIHVGPPTILPPADRLGRRPLQRRRERGIPRVARDDGSQVANHESRVTKHESPVTKHESPVTNHGSRLPGVAQTFALGYP